VSYYSPSGVLCGTVIANQQILAETSAPVVLSTPPTPVSALAAPELPRTGSGTSTLAFAGITLVLFGTAILRMQKKLAA